MPAPTTLTAMQRHVLDNLASVAMIARPKAQDPRYDLRGKGVNPQITSLIVKKLIVRSRSGELSLREPDKN